ncbi:hypothetical protein H1C71_036957, partial [Ictidomys tridecemlineatus]
MTLKISSTTITLEGRRRTFHVWRAYECTRWNERFGASWYNYPHCAFNGNFRGWGMILLVGVQVFDTAPRNLMYTHKYMYMYTHTHTHTHTYTPHLCIFWLESFAQVYLCHWLAGSKVMCP